MDFRIYFTILFLFLNELNLVRSNAIKPILQDILISKNLKENQTTRLVCSIVQGESITFEWFLSNRKLESNRQIKIISHPESSEMVIKQLSIDDMGEYRCSAKNDQGEDEQKVWLVFEVKPIWKIEPQDVKRKYLDDIKLGCDAKSYPSSQIEISKLDGQKKTVIKEFKKNKIEFKLTKDTIGFYRCRATNVIGSIEKIIRVWY